MDFEDDQQQQDRIDQADNSHRIGELAGDNQLEQPETEIEQADHEEGEQKVCRGED